MALLSEASPTRARRFIHPNDLDRKRIERAIERRKRYRYVAPSVVAEEDGYRIESPCCSRNVEPDGGVIDVALIKFDEETESWQLFRKNHGTAAWEFEAGFARLPELLDRLNADPDRKFWQ